MSDAKEEYSKRVKKAKDLAQYDLEIANAINEGYKRKTQYGANWEEVDINDVVSLIAPNSTPILSNGKIIYYNSDKTKSVVADISGYLRVQDLTKVTKHRRYLDKYGNEVYNIVGSNGKIRGRTKNEFRQATHYIIKKRK